MKKYIPYFFALSAIALEMSPVDFSDDQKIAVHNLILAKVNSTTLSMMDVKKKMDVLYHQHYPHLANSSQARYQFYEGSWRHVLMEMIDHQLMLADASDREIKLTDGEIREALEEKFGPNVMLTLDKIGLTYDEAWKMIKEDLLVQRMSWWFIHAKAISQVTPQDIRQAFRSYVKENPSFQEWKYRVISIRSENPETVAEIVHQFLLAKNSSPETISDELQEIDPSIQVSAEFNAADKDLSASHREALDPLAPGQYSAPKIQKSRTDNKAVARIFYLSEKIDHPTPQFETIAPNLRSDLIQKAIAQESSHYIEKLRKHYGFDSRYLKDQIPEDLHPFSLK